MKPLGVYLNTNALGQPTIGVRRSSRAEDAIWNAVEEAVAAEMDVKDFMAEARQAWAEELDKRKKWAMGDFDKSGE
jgi:ABC-type glycerol-3-phosphate transport system substrate-binding protein